MAAVAATGLTCCGGGGSSDSIEFKTFYLSAPGDKTEDGYVAPGTAGSMWLEVQGDVGTGQIPAKFSFGGKNQTGHDATVMQYETEDKGIVKFTFNVYSSENLQQDQDALAFFQKAMDEVETDDEGDVEGIVQFPAMIVTLKYDGGKASGTYDAEFPGVNIKVKVDVNDTPDNPDDDIEEEKPAPPAHGIFSEVY